MQVWHIQHLKTLIFCCKNAKNSPFLYQETPFTTFLSQMSRKSQHTRFEDKVLGQVRFGGSPLTCASLLLLPGDMKSS